MGEARATAKKHQGGEGAAHRSNQGTKKPFSVRRARGSGKLAISVVGVQGKEELANRNGVRNLKRMEGKQK